MRNLRWQSIEGQGTPESRAPGRSAATQEIPRRWPKRVARKKHRGYQTREGGK